MRKSSYPFLLILPLLLGAAPARAQLPTAPGESPRRFAVELKFGPYIPAIDSSAGIAPQRAGDRTPATPFSDLYGDVDAPVGATPSRGLLTLGEFDYQFMNAFGSLGIGIQAGYYRKSARQLAYFTRQSDMRLSTCSINYPTKEEGGMKVIDAEGTRVLDYPRNPAGQVDVIPKEQLRDKDGNDIDPKEGCFSSDDNILNIVPLSVLLVYRFDVLSQRYRVPFIPYIKVGLGYYIWWMGTSGEFVTGAHVNPDGSAIEPEDQQPASGASAGVLVQPGLAFDLGAIDRQVARTLDAETGVNRVTLFVELNYAWMNHFGYPNKLDLSDLSFNAGLGFEF